MNKSTVNRMGSIITKITIDNNNHIVLLDMAGNKQVTKVDCNANIYCIDDSNNTIWQANDLEGMFERDSFIYLELADNNKLAARRFFGKKYVIDIASGLAEEIGWEK